jgi:hypothetical protein
MLHRWNLQASAALVLGLALGLAGCGDDGKKGGADEDPGGGDAAAGGASGESSEPDAAVEAPAPDAEVEDPEPDAAAPEPDAALRGDAAPPEPDAAPPEPVVVEVETILGVPTTTAGLANRVTCEARDEMGEPVAGVRTFFEVRPGEGWRRVEGDRSAVLGERAGFYEITCTAPNLGLRDETPHRWDVVPGDAARVDVEVDPRVVTAGGRARAACFAADAYDNPIPAGGARIEVSPAGGGAEVDGLFVDFTRAGRYRVDCEVDGVRSERGARVDVLPAVASNIAVAVFPERPVYDVGEVVQLVATVTDRFGNRVQSAPVAFTGDPPIPPFGDGRYRPDAEGRYTLTATVGGPTFDGVPLSASAEILVDAGGPAIACERPAPGEMLVVELPGGALELSGRVNDVAGVAGLTIDGEDVEVQADGSFATQVSPTWGLNTHDIVATDAVGNQNSTFCSYFAAGAYLPEDAPLDDGVALALTQGAVDDGAPSMPLRSLVDLLRMVIDSPGLIETLDATLRAQNPVLPNECRQSLPLVGCILRAGAEYRGMRVGGPNPMSGELIDGGIRFAARISNVALDVKLLGTVTNSGTITAEWIDVGLTFDIGLRDGQPDVTLRAVDRLAVGGLDSDFDGVITGFILELVFSAFEGTIRNELVNALRGFLVDNIDEVLSGVLSGLDISALSAQLEIPSLSGGDPIPLDVGFGLTTIDTNAQRFLVGLGTTVGGPVVEAGRSAGVPLPPGPVLLEPTPEGTIGASVSMALLNQLLHQLWRAGLFRIDDVGGLLGDLPEGTSVGLRVLLPPAVIGTGDGASLRLFFGPATGEVLIPDLFATPLQGRLTAEATTSVALVDGTTIQFGDPEAEAPVVIERLSFVVEGAAIDAQSREAIERLLTRVLQVVINQALNDALPALPIPDFALPDSLNEFGVPMGTRLGLRSAALGGTEGHWVVDGEFGE